MKIIIVTQNENIYLPASFAKVCSKFQSDIVCIVTAPAMSTHGGALKGSLKHFNLFGWQGIVKMGVKIITAKIMTLTTSPSDSGSYYSIHQVSSYFGIPYYHTKSLTERVFQNILDKYKPDLLVSISCPQIIGKKIRDQIPKGCINVHGAPLPKYRGLMPAFWVLRNGESMTAVTVHDLAAKLDDGDILLQREVDIKTEDTWDSLVKRTKAVGAQALIDAISMIASGVEKRRPNREAEATYYSFPSAEDRKVFLSLGRRFF